MNLSIKKLFHKFVSLIYGDISTPDNELEKFIDDCENNDYITTSNKFNHNIEPERHLYEPIEVSIKDFDVCDELSQKKQISTEYDNVNFETEQVKLSTAQTESLNILQPSKFNSYIPVEDLANLVTELDMVKTRITSPESREIIVFCQERIIECMRNWPLGVIDSDYSFNPAYHILVPYAIVTEGTPISKYLRVGLKYEDKVLLKALVEI